MTNGLKQYTVYSHKTIPAPNTRHLQTRVLSKHLWDKLVLTDDERKENFRLIQQSFIIFSNNISSFRASVLHVFGKHRFPPVVWGMRLLAMR